MEKHGKALFGYFYENKNAGDFAINIGSLDLISDFYDDVTVIAKSHSNSEEFVNSVRYLNEIYPRYSIIDGPFKLDRNNKYTTLLSYLNGLLTYPLKFISGKYVDLVKNANHVFLNGGNVLRYENFTDFVRLKAILFPVKLALKSNIPYILLPHSTTVINEQGKAGLGKIFDNSHLFLVRENISYEYLKDMYPNSPIYESLDSAFFIKNREIKQTIFEAKYPFIDKNYIAITLRKEGIGDLKELDSTKIESIRNKILDLCKATIESDKKVLFVVQTQKDREFTTSISSELKETYGESVSLIEEYDPLILREIYRNVSCLFGMRLHSMILSMSVGTPVVGFFDREWGIKNPGTLGQFYMPFSFIEEDTNLFDQLNESLNNSSLMSKEIEIRKSETKNYLKSCIEKK